MSRLLLRELPGWDQAVSDVKALQGFRRMGQEIRTLGAFYGAPSIDHMSAPLLKAMTVGLTRHWCLRMDRAELAAMNEAQVIDIRDWSSRRMTRRIHTQRLNNDFSNHWSSNPRWGGDPEL